LEDIVVILWRDVVGTVQFLNTAPVTKVKEEGGEGAYEINKYNKY
jgi:hypothetical protein